MALRLGRWLCRRKGIRWSDECQGECLLAVVHAARRHVPGYGAYIQRNAQNRQAEMGDLQQAGTLMGILKQQQAAQREAAFRGELQALGPDAPPEQRLALGAKYGGADAMQKLAEHQISSREAIEARKAMAAEAATTRREQADANINLRYDMLAGQTSDKEAQRRINEQRNRDLKAIADRHDETLRFLGQQRVDIAKDAAAARAAALKAAPAPIAKAYAENLTALRKIDTAESEVDKYPQAFGLQNIRGDAISQRVDPGGVTARAIVSDIGSLKIHDRSGAAVTAAETPRLMPFIPNVNDNAATIKKKLALFRKEYAAIQKDIESMYSTKQGYKPFGNSQATPSVDDLLEKYK